MSQITVFNNDPANVTVSVVDGNPPVDQTALVASLQAQIATLNGQIAALQTKIANAQAALA